MLKSILPLDDPGFQILLKITFGALICLLLSCLVSPDLQAAVFFGTAIILGIFGFNRLQAAKREEQKRWKRVITAFKFNYDTNKWEYETELRVSTDGLKIVQFRGIKEDNDNRWQTLPIGDFMNYKNSIYSVSYFCWSFNKLNFQIDAAGQAYFPEFDGKLFINNDCLNAYIKYSKNICMAFNRS